MEMTFSEPFAMPQFMSTTPISNSRPQDDLDDFLSSDLELSFASSVSLQSPDFQTTNRTTDEILDLMDISPAPASSSQRQFSKHASTRTCRPRAYTSADCLIGIDISNSPPSEKHSMLHSRRDPLDWAAETGTIEAAIRSLSPPEYPPSPDVDDCMDVDSSFMTVEKLLTLGTPSPSLSPSSPPSPLPLSAAPTATQFSSLFQNSDSPANSFRESLQEVKTKERLSPPPDPALHEGPGRASSPVLDSSPCIRKLERIRSGPLLSRASKPAIEGMGSPCIFLTRTHRSISSATLHPSDTGHAHLALNDCTTTVTRVKPKLQLLSHHAFTATRPLADYPAEPASPDRSYEGGAEMSSPAQAYVKRQSVRTTQHRDGLEVMEVTPIKDNPLADNQLAMHNNFEFQDEALGKILPCRRVTEDGLMRINCQTLDDLLDGRYQSQIAEFHVLDCRFEYEYSGGHIIGAVNVNTPAAVEHLLLGETSTKPRPCTSWDSTKKTVLIFHCEFSVKRAPTFAQHLRGKDRALNSQLYPKVHYPEVYILEGGYCRYFKKSSARCHPPAYISMDDPHHAASRREELGQFRKTKLGRVKSYTYGDGNRGTMFTQDWDQLKRNMAPTGGASALFANATGARKGRSGTGLKTLPEDCNTTQGEGEDYFDDSPCPPTNMGRLMKVAGQRAHRPLSRTETTREVIKSRSSFPQHFSHDIKTASFSPFRP